jgi:hypothetical protein
MIGATNAGLRRAPEARWHGERYSGEHEAAKYSEDHEELQPVHPRAGIVG